MTSNILHQSASNSWNWYEAPSKNLRKFVSGGGIACYPSFWLCYWSQDDFVMKKARSKPFLLFTVLCLALLDSIIVAFYFLTRISIMTAWEKFKPHILWRNGFVVFDSLQSEKVTNTRNVIPAVATFWVVLLDVLCSCVWDFYIRVPYGRQICV